MSKAMRFAGQGVVLVLALLAWFGGLGGPVRITPFMLAGAAFVIAGLAAWSLRPRNRLGPLMAIAGCWRLISRWCRNGLESCFKSFSFRCWSSRSMYFWRFRTE